MEINIIIDGQKYAASLEHNETTLALIRILPQKLKMHELNGNEKYSYLKLSLPTNASNPEKIIAGDVMLYGDNCLVIFYKTFATSYEYTKIGHIDGLPDLGNGDVVVEFVK